MVSILFFLAILATFLAGSMSNTLIFFSFNGNKAIPSFETISTTNEFSFKLNSFIYFSAA